MYIHVDMNWPGTGVTSLTYPPPLQYTPGIINLGPTYRGYIQPRFDIPRGYTEPSFNIPPPVSKYPQPARIQDSEGGGYVHSEGGGGSYRNFRSGSKLLQGPGQINKQKKIADSRRGGGVRSPKKPPCIRACPGVY